MAHHRNAALDEERDRLGHALSAFDLDRAAPGFLHHARRGEESLFLGCFIGAERHVDDDKRPARAAHHRMALQDHHVERHRNRGLESMHHHAERIADEDHVAVLVDDVRGMGVIRREHDDRRTALAGADRRRREPLFFGIGRHRQVPSAGVPNAGTPMASG